MPVPRARTGHPYTVPDRFLHTAQVADILHVSPKTVSRWAKEGRLPHLRTLGGHRRYEERAIRELAESLKGAPDART